MTIQWEKNPDYPTSFTVCRTCGIKGLMKQAWDLHGYLCLDAKTCLDRTYKNRTGIPLKSDQLTRNPQ